MMSGKLLIPVGILIVVQLTLQVIALVQLVKTPKERVTLGGNKVVWAIIIVVTEIIGPIAWFAAGRKPAEVADVLSDATANPAQRDSAVDSLYGKRG